MSILAIGATVFAVNANKRVVELNATECPHTEVGHYAATDSSIEHWACCACHHAWADEAKTIEISENTTTDRSRIDFGSKQYAMATQFSDNTRGDGGWNWSNTGTVIYDAKYTFAYSIDETGMTQAFIGSINEYLDPLDEGKYYFFEITNNTDKELNAFPVNRGWGGALDPVTIPSGQSRIVSASWQTWNGDASKKGPCVRLAPTSGEEFGGNITFSTLQIVNDNPNYYSKVALVPSWDYLDTSVSFAEGDFAIYSEVTLSEASSEVFFESKDTTTALADGKYYMVQVINNSDAVLDVKMVGREWGGTAGNTFTVAIGETAIVYASSATWNSQTKKGVAVRFAPHAGGTFNGTLMASNPVIVDSIPAPTLFSTLAVENSDWQSIPVNLVYDSNYGYCFSFNGANAAHIKFKTVVELDSSLYSGVRFNVYNGGTGTGNCAAWSEDWNNHGNGFATLVAQSWVVGTVTTDTWNGDRGSCDVGLYDFNFNGIVRISFGQLITL